MRVLGRAALMFWMAWGAGAALAMWLGMAGTDAPPLLHEAGAGISTDIYLLDPASGININATRHPAREVSAAWSPDGQGFAFASDRAGNGTDLYYMTFPRRKLTTLAGSSLEDAWPVWSPGGEEVAYLEGTGTFVDLVVLTGDGQRHQLTHDRLVAPRPAWSPDGRWVAYVSTSRNAQNVYIVDMETGASRPVARGLSASSPTWLPDGDTLLVKVRDGGRWTIYAENIETGERGQAITWAEPSEFVVSPDGTRAAYTETGRGLFVAGFDGDDVTQVTDDVARGLAWSGDGAWLAYTVAARGEQAASIWVYADGAASPERVSVNPSADAPASRNLAWRPTHAP